MKKIDIVEFARENGAFSHYSPEDLQYIGDNAQTGAEITYHELLFEDYGYIRTWSFKVDATGKIIPYDDGFKFEVSGFNPDEMRKKLAMVDKAKHHEQIRAGVLRASGRENQDEAL